MLPVVGYNRYPDEKGTESIVTRMTRVVHRLPSYNRYPDEKGTESIDSSRPTHVSLASYNRYPDEKGTERVYL